MLASVSPVPAGCTRRLAGLLLILGGPLNLVCWGAPAAASRAPARPLMFEPNQGQAAPGVRFVARAARYVALLDEDGGVSYDLPAGAARGRVRLELAGANLRPAAAGLERLPSQTHYYAGSNPAAWRTNIPNYAGARYSGVYPGVDLLYHGQGGELEYEFQIAPGEAPGQILLRFDAAPSLDASGGLVVKTEAGALRHRRPVAYQIVAGRRSQVPAAFRVSGSLVGFRLGRYDTHLPLIIDPVVSYSTQLGGVQWDGGYGIASDSAGDAYVTGDTASANFPGRASAGAGDRDVFVTKIRGGSTILYTTILSSAGNDIGRSIAVDAAGNAYVAGMAGAAGFPVTTGAFQRTFGGVADAFVAKLDEAGRLVYCTYIGGSAADAAFGIAVDGAGSVYATGYTESVAFPTTAGAPQRSFGGGFRDAFLLKLSPGGDALVYSTLLGGSGNDFGAAVAVDTEGNAVIAGFSDSPNLPLQNALQSRYGGGGDAMAASLNASGTSWNFVTYLGGSGFDQATGVAVDAAGAVYVTGSTYSADFPATTGAYHGGPRGDYDVYVSKISGSGAMLYSSVLGGSGPDVPAAIAVRADGEAWVCGFTASNDFPLVNPLQSSNRGVFDGFVAAVSADGGSLAFSTYLGGAVDDRISAIALDPSGGVLLTGFTSSADFPTTAGVLQSPGPAGYNAFVTRIQGPPQPPTVVSVTPSAGSGSSQAFAFRVNNPPGYLDLNAMLVLFNSALVGERGCYFKYDAAGNSIAMASDAGQSSWSSAVTLGTSTTLENSQCRLNVGTSSRTASGPDLTLNLDLYFKPAFAGAKSTYVYVDTRSGLTTGWQQYGVWTVP
jgi:hypothetical protein